MFTQSEHSYFSNPLHKVTQSDILQIVCLTQSDIFTVFEARVKWKETCSVYSKTLCSLSSSLNLAVWTLGLTTSEIAVNTIPCCCDAENHTDQQQMHLEEQKHFQGKEEFEELGNANITEDEHEDERDDYLQDPWTQTVDKALSTMNVNLMSFDEDLWRILDQIFECYQPQKLVDQIHGNKGLKRVLQEICDPYTQHAVYQCAINTITHRTKYKFDITKTMKIKDYDTNKQVYQTEQLWFYGLSIDIFLIFVSHA